MLKRDAPEVTMVLLFGRSVTDGTVGGVSSQPRIATVRGLVPPIEAA